MPKILFTNPDGSHLDCEIIHGAMTLGRAPANDICLGDGSVSKFHATIEHHNGVTVIHDQDSSNGITVNGVSTVSAELQDGDLVTVGDIAGTFYANGADDLPLGAAPAAHSTAAGIPVSMAQLDEDEENQGAVHSSETSGAPHPLQKKKGMALTARSPALPPASRPDRKTGVVPKMAAPPQGPVRRPPVVPAYVGSTMMVQQKPDSAGALFYLALIFLAVLAFAGGLYIRHQKESNGGNFFKDAIEAKTGGKVGLGTTK